MNLLIWIRCHIFRIHYYESDSIECKDCGNWGAWGE